MIGSIVLWQPGTPVLLVALFFFVLPLGMGNVMAPGTEAVMEAVPAAKAGVGSAMNDLNRQVAGALGVAVIGSVSSSVYSSRVESATAGLPPEQAHVASDSAGGAAFTDAIGLAMLVGAGVALLGAVLVKRYLPDGRGEAAARPDDAEPVAHALAG